jgi:hypothetical protein
MQNLAKRPESRAQDGRALRRALLQAMADEGMSEAAATMELHSPRSAVVTEVPEEARRPLAVSTTRWSPGSELGLVLAVPSKGLDATLDEGPTRAVHPTLPAPPMGPGSPPSTVLTPTPARVAAVPSGLREWSHETDAGADHEIPYTHRLPWGRPFALGLVVTCFFLGALAVVLVGFRSNWPISGAKQGLTLDLEVARANEAMLHQQWDAPRGANVLETTDEGLRRWPHDPQLLRIRSLASADIVKAARAEREEGNVAEALRLSRLAYELDPSDGTSQKLVAELEAQSQVPTTESVPPLASVRDPGSAPSPALAPTRASLEVSNARPSIGQPIDFVAHVTAGSVAGRGAVQGAAFRVTGPGIAPGTALEAVDGGPGAYRATFAFLQAGRFEVVFLGRAPDGTLLRSSRTLLVSGPAGPPASSAPAPASSAAAPWM